MSLECLHFSGHLCIFVITAFNNENEINVGYYRVSVDTTGNEDSVKNMFDNMIEKIKALWIKYEEIIAYLIVGGLTTVVSWAAKFLANFLLFDNTMYPTSFQNVVLSIINWTAGVIFAYFTNRKFVFKSNAPMLSEAPKFVLSRVSTLILDMVVMQVLTAVGVNLLIATVISAVLVIIGNYVFSKLFVFNKKKDGEAEETK